MKNTKFLELLKKSFKNSKLILVCLLLVLLILFTITKNNNSNNYFISSNCSLADISYGTDNLSSYISTSGNYGVWVHIETPIPISYNVLPGTFNPFYIGIDNSKCYMVNGTNVSLNSWHWVNSVGAYSAKPLIVYLSKGNHKITLVGSYLSVDKIELLKIGCSPTNLNNCQ